MPISIPPKGDFEKRIGAHFTPLKVEAQDNPDMTVKINAGSFWTSTGQHQEYVGGTSPTIVPPTSQAMWVVITINDDGLINVYNGTPSGDPELPTLPENVLPLGAIFVGDTTSVITSDMVFDIRPLWQVRPEHVPNVGAELASRPTLTDINALLATKADIGGTPSETFVMNQDHVGVPGADVELIVNRGANPNVSIRWSEANNQWEFTNDGVSWDPIGASSGVFYTQSALDGGALDNRYFTETELINGALDNRYYTEGEIDTQFAPIAHQHTVNEINDFVNQVATNAPVQSVAGKTGVVTLEEADIINLDKYNTVPGAVANNITIFGATGLLDSGVSYTNISLTGHTHNSSDILDLNTTIQTIFNTKTIGDLSDVVNVGPGDGQVLVYETNGFINKFLKLEQLDDVDIVTPSTNNVLVHNGVQFINRALVKSDITDLGTNDYVYADGNVDQNITGIKTFTDTVVLNGNVSVNSANFDLLADQVKIKDNFVSINSEETGSGVTAVTSGIRIKRGTEPDALIYWNETSSQWEVGVTGNVVPLGAYTINWTEITDFTVGTDLRVAQLPLSHLVDVDYPTAPTVGQILRFDGTKWINTSAATTDMTDFPQAVTSALGNNSISTLQDVSFVSSLADRHVLAFNSTTLSFENRALVKADITDFVESDYVDVTNAQTISGNKTFVNDVIVSGNLIVNGTTTSVNTNEVTVSDNVMVLNDGEAGAGVTAGQSGIEIDRGTESNVQFYWDEPSKKWRAHIGNGSGGVTVKDISFVDHTHDITEIDGSVIAVTELNTLNGIDQTQPVQTQLDDKISRQGDSMAPGANLSFSGTGEILGLPVVPSVGDAAAAKTYVDTQDNTIIASLAVHDGDDTKHLTSAQNQFLDGLDLANLTAQEVNRLIGVSSPIQAQIDSKASLISPAIAGNLIMMTNTGDIIDAGIKFDDTTNANDVIWSADKIDTTKADKIVNPVAGNFVSTDANGNLTDSGYAASSFSNIGHTHTTANILNFDFDVDTRIAAFAADMSIGIEHLSDVISTGYSTNDILRYNGINWTNVQLIKAHVTDFVETDYVHSIGTESIAGDKTFTDNVIVDGDLTINGTMTTVNATNLEISDKNIVLNNGYVGPTSGANNSGITIIRDAGTNAPTANFLWDETNSTWVGGIAGSEKTFSMQGHYHHPDYNILIGKGPAAGANEEVYNTTFTFTAPQPNKAAVQVFVNGIKAREGATKDFVATAPNTITFNSGSEPHAGDDVEIYGFG